MTLTKIIIYYFTGTGNSHWASSQIVNTALKAGYKAEMEAIDNLVPGELAPGGEDSLTGFIYPTHGFSLPWFMLKFLIRYPEGSGRVFVVNNRAGMKMGKLFTPGLSGIAAHLAMLILLLKGYRVVATQPLDTPSNWITVHPGLKSRVVSSIFDRRRRDLDNLCDHIFQNRRYFPLKYLLLIPVDTLLIPVSLAYMFFGRFIFARSYFSDSSCDGCSICANRCPANAIIMKQNRPYWTHKCESCMRCSNVCPKKSINSSIPILILLSWILSILTSYIIDFKESLVWMDTLPGLAATVLHYLILWIVTLILSWSVYMVLFHLNRLRFISYIISRTTPMHWWRRYIAPGFRGLYKK
jgi:ferredoxin